MRMLPIRSRMSPTDRDASSRFTLRAVQLVLGLLVVALLLVGRSEHYFPITGWPLYESIVIPRPDASVNATYLRVTLRDGGAREVAAEKLVEYSRAGIVQNTINAATVRDDSPARTAARKHLALLLSMKLGSSTFDSIRVTQRVWNVDLARVPPVQIDRPVVTVPVDHFAVPR